MIYHWKNITDFSSVMFFCSYENNIYIYKQDNSIMGVTYDNKEQRFVFDLDTYLLVRIRPLVFFLNSACAFSICLRKAALP